MQIKLLRGDTIVKIVLAAAALFIIGLLVALAVELYLGSAPSISIWTGFLIGSKWERIKYIWCFAIYLWNIVNLCDCYCYRTSD